MFLTSRGAIAAPTGAALVPETGHDVALMGAAIHSETGHDVLRLEVLAFGEAAVLEKSKVTSKPHRICERLPRDAGCIVDQRWHHWAALGLLDYSGGISAGPGSDGQWQCASTYCEAVIDVGFLFCCKADKSTDCD